MRLCNAAEMVAMDQGAIKTLGIPGAVLMENAGRACCRYFNKQFKSYFPGPVLVVCGKGNNGGDGYVMARILADQGWQVQTLVLAERDAITGDARIMLDIVEAMQLEVRFSSEESEIRELFSQVSAGVVVDAIFGTGLASDVKGLQAAVIDLINDADAAVFAVDIPSGIDSSSGRICGRAVRADVTVTFAQAKIGHGSQPGAEYSGRLEVVDIGIPFMNRTEFSSQTRLIEHDDAQKLLPERPFSGHKGTFGHALIIAGAPGKSGAAALAGNSAGRSGCGLVTVATPGSVHDIIEVKLTEVMSAPLAEDATGLIAKEATLQLGSLITGRQVVAIGPGLGQSFELETVLQWLFENVQVPLVIDADGLNLLAQRPELMALTERPPLLLTPHPGEMARLTGLSVPEIQSRRYEVAQDFAIRNQVVLLLKGVRTIIAAPDGRVNINSSGCDALASGGSGDVLTGLIAGLVAQGLDGFNAATLGAWLHGRAAEIAAEEYGSAGVIASDLIARLPQSRHELVRCHTEDPC